MGCFVIRYNILYKEIFVYSNTNKDSLYQVNFANVGDGNGNYILDSSLINGTVFKWIEPVNGEPQGNYSPSKILIPAEKNKCLHLEVNTNKEILNYH